MAGSNYFRELALAYQELVVLTLNFSDVLVDASSLQLFNSCGIVLVEVDEAVTDDCHIVLDDFQDSSPCPQRRTERTGSSPERCTAS